ncbi:hypothetical protein GIB67_012296 [Kingdonia uniflora]|uniref:RRM domain-containing protein n=1 Tax=Kingdonia uniflora TaxID=39325 RepID=A0A7J7MVC0_9MAGN|nr:hypothetical protein GIB67_012296 [Kingdonia uniflora]
MEQHHHQIQDQSEHEVYGVEIPDETQQQPNLKENLEDMKKRLKQVEEEADALRKMQAKVEKDMDPSGDTATPAEKEEVDSRSIYVGNIRRENNEHLISKGKIITSRVMQSIVEDSTQDGDLAAIRRLQCLWTSPALFMHGRNPLQVSLSLTLMDLYLNCGGYGAIHSDYEGTDIDAYVGNVSLQQTTIHVDYASTPEEVQQHFQSCGTVNRVTILTDKFGQPKGFAYVEFVEVDAVQNALLLNESELHSRQLKVSAKRTNVPGMKQYQGRGPSPYLGFRGPRPFVPSPYYSPYPYG